MNKNETERKATIHEEALKLIKSERDRVAKNLGKSESRWLHGYVDGLDKAIRIISQLEGSNK